MLDTLLMLGYPGFVSGSWNFDLNLLVPEAQHELKVRLDALRLLMGRPDASLCLENRRIGRDGRMVMVIICPSKMASPPVSDFTKSGTKK